MKAPDKIYMPNELLSEEWQRHIEGEDTCYIRKDYLLEWAKEEMSKWRESHPMKYKSMADLIDKLNEI